MLEVYETVDDYINEQLQDPEFGVLWELADARHWAALWKQAAKEGRRTILMLLDELEQYQSVDVPIMGALSADTTPDDFKRFANGS